MNEKELFEQAAARAEKINKTCKDYELARTSLEALQQDNAVLHIIVESIDKAEEKRFTLASLARSSELAIIDHLKSLYSQRIDKCKEIVSEYVQAEKETEKPSTAAVKVSNERIEQLQAEGLSPTQIAKVTGMKPDTVTHRIRYNKDKIDRKAKTEKPDPTPRVLSKDIISDTELEEQYFKFGKTVKEIAQKYGIKPDGLYKRVEAMKVERQNIAKECVSSQQ